jgi:trimeric autotransporter adhesin
MTISSRFHSDTGLLETFGDFNFADVITISRDAAGTILVNDGQVPVTGGPATVANTTEIQVNGQGGNDTLSVDDPTGTLPQVELFGNEGNDTLIGGNGTQVLDGGPGDDTLTGGAGDDTLFGESGADHFIWNPGDGSDRVEGDAGFDTLEVNGGNGAETFTITPDGTRVHIGGGNPAPFTIDAANVETIVINAKGGNDTIIGANGLAGLVNLTIDGGAGNDTIVGGDGTDLLLGGDDNDVVTGGKGNDVAGLGAGNDTFIWNLGDGNDAVDGGDGQDLLDLIGSNLNEAIDISGFGGHVSVFHGSGAIDLIGVEGIRFHALGGRDSIAINDTSGTDLGRVVVDLEGALGAGTGDGEADLVTVNGTAGNETISVTSVNGVITINGVSAPVSVLHADAFDQLDVNGGAGEDAISAAAVPAGALFLTFDGGEGNDTLTGSQGKDVLVGGAGADTMMGGAGDDLYIVDDAGDTVIESPGQGNDTVRSLVNYRLTDNVEDLVLLDPAADLQGYGNALANTIVGKSGNNLLDGGAGADTMIGRDGNDVYFVDNAGDAVIEDVAEGNDAVFSTAHFGLSANVETLVLQGGADLQGYGNDLANTLFGNTGNNLLDGGAGADSMIGGAGNDVYFVDNAADAVFENANEGNDAVFASAHYALTANVETLVLQGGADLQGFGNGSTNTLFGNSGNNLLDGRGGADIMAGGVGNDTYFADNTADAVVESAGEGSDAVFASVNYRLADNVETLVLQGSADLQGFGNGAANSIFGNSGNNLIDGGAGADVMSGGAGNDTYFVDNAGDAVIEAAGAGSDAVFASISYALTNNVETLVLQGNNNLNGTGNVLANAMFGNSGNNTLDGGAGADILTGNGGNDTFVFNAGQGNGDTVVDFAGNGAAAGDSLRFVGYGAGASFTNIDATHWQVNFNGGAAHDVIAFLNGATIDPSDFLFA